MELTTQCPECGTRFEASLEQLQLRKGYIRCISCAHIFDGFEAVVPTSRRQPSHTVGESAPPPAATSQTHTVPPMPGIRMGRPSSASMPRPASSTSSSAGTSPLVEDPSSSAETSHFVGNSSPSVGTSPFVEDSSSSASTPQFIGESSALGDSASPGIISARPAVSGPVTDDRLTAGVSGARPDGPPMTADPVYLEPRNPDAPPMPGFLGSDRPEPSVGLVWLFRVAVVLALLAAAAQLAYIYRVQIATQLPFLRPPLESVCQNLGCTVGYPRLIDQIAIVESSLKKSAESVSGSQHDMVLHVLLRNNYDKPQEWPSLSLDLTDFSGTTVARLLLDPASYLSGYDPQYPFPARTEVQISLPLAVSDRQVSGYQLGKYFP